MADGELILVAGALLAAGLLASLLATRLRVPGLVLFLGLGMVIGSDAAGWIDFSNYELAQTIGVVALSLILFEGGLVAGLPEIRPVLVPAASLATIGTLLTAVVTGFAAAWLFGFTTLEGLLVGSIVASTDGAAIFAVLRGSTLRRRLARTLEGESGLNDPVAVFLVLGFIHWIQRRDYGLVDLLGEFAREMVIGAAAGVLVGWLAVEGFKRVRLPSSGLYPVASLASVALAFGAADSLGGSGFLAVYMTGLALGGAAIPARTAVTAFHEGLAWLAQLTMFLALGLLVSPHQLGDVALKGTILAVVLTVVARPLAVFVATAFEGFTVREKVVLGWAGLRGAVPVVLATFPVTEHVSRSRDFFDIVFFAVVLSTVLQGSTFEWLAARLGVTTDEPAVPRPLVEVSTIRRLGAENVEYRVADEDALVGARVRDLGLPREALLNVIVRGDEALLPRGSTRVEADDRLHLLVRREVAGSMGDILARWRSGPVGPPPRPRAVPAGTTPIFTTRPWRPEEDGDPAYPTEVEGLAVVTHLRTRRDRAGALVVLADGRFAVTGPLLMLGARGQVQDQARRRLRLTKDDAEEAWWQEVIGASAV